MIIRFITLLAAFVLLFSCKEEKRCYESSSTLMVATFTGSVPANIDSLIIKGVDRNDTGDTLVYDKTETTSKHIELPLSLSADSTGFQLFANGKSATLYIHHTMLIRLISEECGFAPEYQLKSAEFTSNIDSVTITDAVVNTKSSENHAESQNITIYFNLPAN